MLPFVKILYYNGCKRKEQAFPFFTRGEIATMKIIYAPELPKTFIYQTATHKVVGTGEKIDEKVMKDERVHSEKR
jgi:hypothetical protein